MNDEKQTAIPKPKRKHTGLIVFLCVLFALLLAVGVIAWRYRAGLRALIDGYGKSSEQLAEERSDYERRTQELLDKLGGGEMSLSALSEADRERLKNGEITPSEAAALIMGIPTAATTAPDATTAPGETTLPGETTAPGETIAPGKTTAPGETAAPGKTIAPGETTAPAKTTRPPQTVIADIYLLRAEYLNKLDLLIEEGKAEVLAASKGKPKLTISLNTVNRYLSRGEALEKECDGRMETLLSELAESLRADGGDLSLVDEARALYAEEKALYKSELMNKYKKYL